MSTPTDGQVQTLLSLLQRLSNLRLQDTILTSPHSASESQIKSVHALLADFTQDVKLPQVQAALHTARQSEKADVTDIAFDEEDTKMINTKRRKLDKQAEPEVPPPPKLVHAAQSVPLPSFALYEPVTLQGLPNYIRQVNRPDSDLSLHVWSTSHSQPQLSSPLILRASIKDVCVIYLDIETNPKPIEGRLCVRSAVALGPREKKLPQSSSEYVVFRQISQFFDRVLAQSSDIPLQVVVDLVATYRTVYFDTCSKCGKGLSSEEYLPPLRRFWVKHEGASSDGGSAGLGRWEPRHLNCHDL